MFSAYLNYTRFTSLLWCYTYSPCGSIHVAPSKAICFSGFCSCFLQQLGETCRSFTASCDKGVYVSLCWYVGKFFNAFVSRRVPCSTLPVQVGGVGVYGIFLSSFAPSLFCYGFLNAFWVKEICAPFHQTLQKFNFAYYSKLP